MTICKCIYKCINKIWCLQCSKPKSIQYFKAKMYSLPERRMFPKAFLKIISILFLIEVIVLTSPTYLLKGIKFSCSIYLHCLLYILVP